MVWWLCLSCHPRQCSSRGGLLGCRTLSCLQPVLGDPAFPSRQGLAMSAFVSSTIRGIRVHAVPTLQSTSIRTLLSPPTRTKPSQKWDPPGAQCKLKLPR